MLMHTPQKSCSPSCAQENPYLVVPDGAVQRLLRQTDLPGSMTMHRAPLDLLEDLAREQKEQQDMPVSLLLGFDTEGGHILDTRSARKKRLSLLVSRDYPAHLKHVEDADEGDDQDLEDAARGGGEEELDIEGALFADTPEKRPAAQKPEDVAVKYVHPIGSNMAAAQFSKSYLRLVPDSINNFLVPHGRCLYDAPAPPKLFNFAVNLPNNSLVYGCCLLMYREVQVRIPVNKPKAPPTPSLPVATPVVPTSASQGRRDDSGSGRGHIGKTPGTSSKPLPFTPHSRQQQHPPPKTPLSSFKSLAALDGGPDSTLVTPLKSAGGVGDWIGQMSLSSVKSSPFMERVKGLAMGTPGNKPDIAAGDGAEARALIVSQHTRGGSDDISSGSDGSGLGSSSMQKQKGKGSASHDSTINKVEETYAKLVLEQAGLGGPAQEQGRGDTTPLVGTPGGGGSSRDAVFTPPLPPNGPSDVPDKLSKPSSRRLADNSILIAPTPAPSARNKGGQMQTQTQMSLRSASSDSTGSRDEMLVPMYAAHGFCLLTSVPCINALRQPLSLLATDQARLQGVLESESAGGYSDFETSEDEIEYEYSDDSSDGGARRERCPSDSLDASVASVYEINAKTRSLRALNVMETDRSLAHLRQLHAESSLNLKLPSLLRHGGAQDFNAEMVLRALSPRNLVTLLLAFLLECKIAVVSSKLTALLGVGELLKVLIAPLKWSHVYCPLLPKQFSNDLLQCPTPFYVGVQREFLDLAEMPGDVVVLDMDCDSCTVTESLGPALPAGKKLTKTLTLLLSPALHCCDDLAPPAAEKKPFAGTDMAGMTACSEGVDVVREVLRFCKLFLADVLVGLEECCTFGIDHDEAVVLFDEAMFLASKAARRQDSTMLTAAPDCDFLPQFLRTQCFSLCVIGTVLKKLGPDSRPPSRPSSPYISIPSPTLLALPSSSSVASHVHTAAQQLPTTPVQMS
jgi:hypothetical protein